MQAFSAFFKRVKIFSFKYILFVSGETFLSKFTKRSVEFSLFSVEFTEGSFVFKNNSTSSKFKAGIFPSCERPISFGIKKFSELISAFGTRKKSLSSRN